MKTQIIILLFVFVGFNSLATTYTVNAVIGDQSFFEKFGKLPTIETDDNLRIQTHLDFVEKSLRASSVAHLSAKAKAKRAELLDALHVYWTKNVFPQPLAYFEGRKPCFIDGDGSICAVGYLIEIASGRDVAERINSKYQYEYLLEMDDPLIDNWASEHGFSLTELAMIQPTYNPYPSPYIISPTYFEVGPSKKERALRAELDTLRPIHDSIVSVLDSTERVFGEQIIALEKLQKKYDQSIANHKKSQAQSQEKIGNQMTIIFLLVGSFSIVLGYTVFRKIRAKR